MKYFNLKLLSLFVLVLQLLIPVQIYANESDEHIKRILNNSTFYFVLKEIRSDLSYDSKELKRAKPDFKEAYNKFIVPRLRNLKFTDLLIHDYFEDDFSDGEVLIVSTIGSNPLIGYFHQKDYLYILRRKKKNTTWSVEDKALIQHGRIEKCITKRSSDDWCSIYYHYYSTNKEPISTQYHVKAVMTYENPGASGATWYVLTIHANKYFQSWDISENSLPFNIKPFIFDPYDEK